MLEAGRRVLEAGRRLFAVRMSLLAVMMISVSVILYGCSVVDTDIERKKEVDYTIAAYEDVPDEVKKIIEEKKENPFSTVISDRENTYIVVGYGRKNMGGYQIKLKDIYESDTDVFVRLEFMGPDMKSENGEVQNDCANGTTEHYPVIIIKTEYTQKSVNVMQ